MNLCLNAFVIQFPDGLLDTCSVSPLRALLLPFAHRGHCKDEDSYKECSSHVELSIGLTRSRRENPAFNYGFFRPNPLAFERTAWKNGEHVLHATRDNASEQTQIARPGSR